MGNLKVPTPPNATTLGLNYKGFWKNRIMDNWITNPLNKSLVEIVASGALRFSREFNIQLESKVRRLRLSPPLCVLSLESPDKKNSQQNWSTFFLVRVWVEK